MSESAREFVFSLLGMWIPTRDVRSLLYGWCVLGCTVCTWYALEELMFENELKRER